MRLILLKKQNKRDTDRIKICKFAKTRGVKLLIEPRKTRVNTLKIMNNEKTSSAGPRVIEKDNVTVRFSGDSGDGMQLAGNIFSTVSAISGNDICTFPNYPADIRAPQGTRSGVSAFQVHIGSGKVYTPGDSCDILVAMNAAALATQYMFCKPTAAIIIDSDCFKEADLKKANYKTLDPVEELGIKNEIVQVPITSMVKDCLKDSGMDNKSILKSRNMFALGLIFWLFDRNLGEAEKLLRDKFAKKPAVAEANVKVLEAGYYYGHNTHTFIDHTYRIETSRSTEKGRYMDISGNKATAYGLIAAAEKLDKTLYLGSYPITPASDVLHELAKHKSLGVITVQCEDEIAGCASAIGASFGGALAVTSTSGPGICLKSEAMNLAVMTELPLVVIDVMRGGPSTGLPTKSEQSDLLQALFGRNGESPMPVIAATSPVDCFYKAYAAAKIAQEHTTPVILLSDAFIANGTGAFRIPTVNQLPDINPPYVPSELAGKWTPYMRDEKTGSRYLAYPGQKGFEHVIGGLEKSNDTGEISGQPENHALMTRLRAEKVARIPVPDLVTEGEQEGADLLIVGFGGTYGHLHSAFDELVKRGEKVAFAHFSYINPLPANTAQVLRAHKRVVVAELNGGQLAAWLRMNVEGVHLEQYNQVTGQPFNVGRLVDAFEKIIHG